MEQSESILLARLASNLPGHFTQFVLAYQGRFYALQCNIASWVSW